MINSGIYKLLFWLWFALLAIISLLPGKILADTGITVSATGFWEHILAYGVLALLGTRVYAGRRLGMILAGVLLVSIGFEVIQSLFLGRTFNPMDVVANGVGLGGGLGLNKSFKGIKWLRLERIRFFK